jgi:light-regulated signal transduction histidine kinase (bacteriophytochrome)
MTEGAVTLNKEGIILYSNYRFAELVNLPLSKVIGQLFQSFIALPDQNRFVTIFNKGWKEDCKGEILLISGSKPVSVQLSLATLELENGFSLSAIITDLTTQNNAQQELKSKNNQLEEANLKLERSNNDLQQFASVASHDLQEPLRKIITFANIINDTLSDNSTEIAARYIEKILSASSRMRNLIHDILSYSRLSQDDNILKLTNLKLLIEEVQEDFELVLEEKKAKIIIHDLPEIEVNRGQMRQVFQNLISNSLKFSDKKRSPLITIKSERIGEPTFESRVREDGNYYRLTIQDNGIGFDEQYASGIFALFHRLHSKDSFEGTGIGLAITKKIIEKHKGLIMAKSKAGAGSSFIFILPAFQNT